MSLKSSIMSKLDHQMSLVETISKFDKLSTWLLSSEQEFDEMFLDSKHVLKVYFKPSRKNQDVFFLPLPLQPVSLANGHLNDLMAYHSWQSRATNHSTKSQRSRGWLKPGFPLPACRRRGTWPRCRRSYVVPSYPRVDTFSVPSGLRTSASSVRSLCRTWWSTPTTRSTPWSDTCRRARSPRELQNKIPNL